MMTLRQSYEGASKNALYPSPEIQNELATYYEQYGEGKKLR